MSDRRDDTFPTLTHAEIARLAHFGEPRHYRDGDPIARAGIASPGMSIVLSGLAVVTTRDGLGRVMPFETLGPGQFLGELASLSHADASLVDIQARGDVELLRIPPEGVRAVVVAEADLGERIVRAMMLRRMGLIAAVGGGVLVIGAAASTDVLRLQSFLTRAAIPHHVLDPATDPVAADLAARHAEGGLPLVIASDGGVLHNPHERALAQRIGLLCDLSSLPRYDVAIVGCGPAGLATAVYAASEGLSVVVLDRRWFGGQAGASARIENYFGFPTGITGLALTGRAYVQARKFGTEILYPVAVHALDCSRRDGAFEVLLDDDHRLRARAVVVASGAQYRRLPIANLADFEGRGVWYWASPIESRLCAGQHVLLVGGGNSAGQAAVFLAGHAAKVSILIRGARLAATMSQYLVDRIASTPNIELHTETSIVALDGDGGLERVTIRTGDREATVACGHVFLFIGADPATAWLGDCGVERDRSGFVVTGAGASPLESSVPGVFAVGDVRSGSVKRVGSAIGEGAQVVAALHRYLADHS